MGLITWFQSLLSQQPLGELGQEAYPLRAFISSSFKGARCFEISSFKIELIWGFFLWHQWNTKAFQRRKMGGEREQEQKDKREAGAVTWLYLTAAAALVLILVLLLLIMLVAPQDAAATRAWMMTMVKSKLEPADSSGGEECQHTHLVPHLALPGAQRQFLMTSTISSPRRGNLNRTSWNLGTIFPLQSKWPWSNKDLP